MSGCFIAAWAVERDVSRIASDHPALWREIRRFNLPVKLALAAAQRVLPALESPKTARLIGLAPCRPGSPELRAISRDLDAGFARGSSKNLRVNPIYTLHAIDNLGLSALSLRLENREPVSCLGGAAGQAWEALDEAMLLLASGAVNEVLVFGGDQSDASWRGELASGAADPEACGVALVMTAKPQRTKLVGMERVPIEPWAIDGAVVDHAHRRSETVVRPHAARGLAGWLAALQSRYAVPDEDGDGIDRITLITEAL
ncbi:MAG TPA: hypothetical protein VMZ53_06825 [Kofleriaceae bacterium]|nr:hypothetical protein [Kofleriaceae bacterium]